MATQSKEQPASESCSPTEPGSCGTSHWRDKSEAEWQKTLSPEQFQIARQAGTEQAFTGKYWDTKTKGAYHCACCGQELFRSETKYDSGTGWPSFHQPVKASVVATRPDPSIPGRPRVEVRCAQCDAHLGHVFQDGPKPTGQRFCMNSAVLNLVPDDATKK